LAKIPQLQISRFIESGLDLAKITLLDAYKDHKFILQADVKNAYPSLSKDTIMRWLGDILTASSSFLQNLFNNPDYEITPLVYFSTNEADSKTCAKMTKGLPQGFFQSGLI